MKLSSLNRASRKSGLLIFCLILPALAGPAVSVGGAAAAPLADLSLTMTDSPDPVLSGANITYTINVTNNGPDGATNVLLNDTLPAGTTFVSLSAPAGWSCTTPPAGAGGAVSCSNASLAPGTSAFTLVVQVNASAGSGTVISNTAAVSSAGAGFSTTLVTGGLSSPTAMAFAPDGRLFVCQQGGQLRVIKNGALLATPFLTVGTTAAGERGLLGLAFDPGFASNGFVYVYYTVAAAPVHNRVSRFTADGDTAVPGSEVVILELDNLSGATNHNGGAMHFGSDGKLYIAVGENATPSNSQTLGNLLGKMLRINADGTIPEDNPFFNTATGKNRAIWALGLRNPFTFDVQPGTGKIFINDVGSGGAGRREEVNEGAAGANYGWPTIEGVRTTQPLPTIGNYRDPVYNYNPAAEGGCAITGGTFYNPPAAQFPAEYTGAYFFADFCAGWIRRLAPPNYNAAGGFATGISFPVDLKVSADGSLYYLARGGGSVSRITHTSDPNPGNESSTATTTVVVPNTAPSAVAPGPAPSTDEDTPALITLTGTDAQDDQLAFDITAQPGHGTLGVLSAPDCTAANTCTATVTYTPAANYNGPDSFKFKVNDGSLDSAEATVAVTVNAVNDQPAAGAQSVTTAEDTPKAITLTASDVEGGALAYTVTSGPSHGTLAGTGAGRTYTPAADYHGADSFTFRVNDGTADSAPATVSITVTPVNDAPTAVGNSYITAEDQPLNVAAPGVLANDLDPESAALAAVPVANPSGGTLTLNADGSLTYTPNLNFNGTDTFTYKANDGTLDSGAATVTITVSPVNDAPDAAGDAAATSANTPVDISVLSNDTDVDGDALSLNAVTQGTGGTAVINPGNTVTFTPSEGFSGAAAFTYTASDGKGGADTATVSVTVSAGGTLQFGAPAYNASEGGGFVRITVTRAGAGATTVSYATSDGTARAGSDYVAAQGTLSFAEGETARTFDVAITDDSLNEPAEGLELSLTNATGSAALGSPATVTLTIADDDPAGGIFGFGQSTYTVAEGGPAVRITVARSGDTRGAAAVDYATSDLTASSRSDYTSASGTLSFAAGETAGTFDVLVTEDSYVEGAEALRLGLSNPTGGAVVGISSPATLEISDDVPETAGNPIDDPESFVRQHYHDFLNREPDAAGLRFWTNQLTECESRPEAERQGCREVRRINVSAAFFLSIEFQETGGLVYHFYTAALDRPAGLPRLAEFSRDTQRVQAGVVVGDGDWRARLEANKQAYAGEFVTRAEFVTLYPTALTPERYAEALYGHARLTPSPSELEAAAGEFGGAADTSDAAARARALRRVSQSAELRARERNRAFVLMQYLGYLRRDPDAAPNTDFSGYDFWLRKLDQFGGNFIRAEMVKAFITSGEYRERFGQ